MSASHQVELAPVTLGWSSPSKTLLLFLRDAIICLLLTLIAPNLILFLLFGSSHVETYRGFFNVELGVFVAVYVFSRSRAVLALVCLELIADLFEPVAHTFYFDTKDAVEALKYLTVLPTGRLLAYFVALSIYVASAAVLTRVLTRRLQRRAVCTFGIAVLCGSACTYDVAGGRYNRLHGEDGARIGHSVLIRTPIASLGHRWWQVAFPPSLESATLRSIDSPMAHVFTSQDAALWASKPNVFLIGVEAWGLMQDDALRATLIAPLSTASIQSRYRIEVGSVPFLGGTFLGETRDLCGQVFGHGIEDVPASELKNCYPARFAAQGYETTGLHGFYPRMYGRERWFPKVGFQHMLFSPDFAALGMRTCAGGLVGTCDTDIAQYVHHKLLTSHPGHPQFIHWMTLDSHLPVNVNRETISAAGCQNTPGLSDDAVCVWHWLVRRVNEEIASVALDPALPPTVFVITGDHAPPFYNSAKRALFSQDHVPYVILRPRMN